MQKSWKGMVCCEIHKDHKGVKKKLLIILIFEGG